MKTIAIIHGVNKDNEPTNSPAESFPSDAIAIACDGEKYVVYQPGDEIPPSPITETTEAA